MDKKLVDIIITTYNRRTLLLEILERLKYQTVKDFNVIIQDDGSRPNQYINITDYPFVTIYDKHRDIGYHRVKCFNEGIRQSISENIILLDDDCVPLYKEWINQHLKNLIQYDISRGIVRFKDGGVAHGAKSSWFTTTNTGFRANKLKSIEYKNNIGGFDMGYDGHYGTEDHDLGEECKKRGYSKSPYITFTEVSHKGKYYKDGDRSEKVVGHNNNYFINKWGYSYKKIDGRR